MIGPAYYNCAFAEDHKMYNINGRLTYLDYVESTPETGTMEYAIAYPMSFILGVEESGYDWLYSDHDNELWGASRPFTIPVLRDGRFRTRMFMPIFMMRRS